MKMLTHWFLALTLPVFASAVACDDKDDDDDDDGGDGDDDDDDDGDDGDDDGAGDDGPGPGPGDDGFPTDDGPGDDAPSDDDGAGDEAPSDDDGAGDDGPSGGQVGDQCTADADCADNACLFAGDVDYGFCSKVCESFSDCPSFWSCETVGNASATYCVPD